MIFIGVQNDQPDDNNSGGRQSKLHKPSAPSTTSSHSDFVFDLSAMETFVKLHRSEIRSTTEACKEETRLLSNYTSMNPAQLMAQAMNGGGPTSPSKGPSTSLMDRYRVEPETGKVERLADGLIFETTEAAKLHEAMEYLEKLDEVLAQKQEVVHQLRTKIRGIIWGDDPSITTTTTTTTNSRNNNINGI